jgi:hypothetical protein
MPQAAEGAEDATELQVKTRRIQEDKGWKIRELLS